MTWPVGILFANPSLGGHELTEHAQFVESLGFRWFVCGEHVLFSVPISNAFVTLAHIGAVTERIELVSGVTLAPLYPAAQLAKMASTLDVTSDGRFNLGIGVGGEYPLEFAACGVPLTERGARTNEALEIVRACWTGERIDYQGRFAQVQGRMRPRPKRVPPIWIGGRKEVAVRRAAKYGDVWYPYMVSPEQVATGHQLLQQAVADEGRAPGSVDTITFCFVSIDTNGDAARDAAAAHVGAIYNQDMSGAAGRLIVAGNPEDCVARITEYAAAGSSGLVVSLVGALDTWNERARLFADEVLPAISTLDQQGRS